MDHQGQRAHQVEPQTTLVVVLVPETEQVVPWIYQGIDTNSIPVPMQALSNYFLWLMSLFLNYVNMYRYI